MDGGGRATFQGLQKAVLVPLRLFDEERSTARAFAVRHSVLIRGNDRK